MSFASLGRHPHRRLSPRHTLSGVSRTWVMSVFKMLLCPGCKVFARGWSVPLLGNGLSPHPSHFPSCPITQGHYPPVLITQSQVPAPVPRSLQNYSNKPAYRDLISPVTPSCWSSVSWPLLQLAVPLSPGAIPVALPGSLLWFGATPDKVGLSSIWVTLPWVLPSKEPVSL